MANIDFEQKLDFLLKGLRFKALFSYKNYNKTITSRSQGINRYTLTGYTQNADGSYSLNISPFGSSNPSKPVLSTTSSVAGDRRIYFQSYVDYMNKFGNHNVSGMLLWNIDQYDNNAPGNLVASLPRRMIMTIVICSK